MLIPEGDQRDLLVYAFRYALGRKTYAVHTVSGIIVDKWEGFTYSERSLFQREIRQHISAFGLEGLGMECDIKCWTRILDLQNKEDETLKP